MRILALLAAFIAILGVFATIGNYAPQKRGPMPTGTRIAEGVVLSYDASDGARSIVAEVRGLRTEPGAVREVLYLAHEPFTPSDFEVLGRGATLGGLSPGGKLVSWLASKERGERTGPGRLRRAEPDATPQIQRALLPPVLFDDDTARAVSITTYLPSPGRGALTHFDMAAGTSELLSPNIPAGAFGLLTGDRTFALRRPYNAPHAEAVVLSPSASPAIPLATNVDFEGPSPVFRIASDRRSVTMRLAPDAQGRRALVRWTDGVPRLLPIADDAFVWALDGDGRAWWVSGADGALRAHREAGAPGGTPVLLGEIVGRDAVSIHPLPSGAGAWIAMSDRPCVTPPATAAIATTSGGPGLLPAGVGRPAGGCTRLALAGAGAKPPAVEGLRRVVAATEGWPVVLVGPVDGNPAFVTVGEASAPIAVEGGNFLGASFSPDRRYVAARISADDGERIVRVDLASGTTTLLAEQAPESLLSWHGDTLVYVWRNRWWRLDPRNGLYRFTPAPLETSP